jgi:hypothetical protein
VVEIPDEAAGFVEDVWVGRTLAIGETLRLDVLLPCPRCVMATLSQGNAIPRDVGILRTIAPSNQRRSLNWATWPVRASMPMWRSPASFVAAIPSSWCERSYGSVQIVRLKSPECVLCELVPDEGNEYDL